MYNLASVKMKDKLIKSTNKTKIYEREDNIRKVRV